MAGRNPRLRSAVCTPPPAAVEGERALMVALIEDAIQVYRLKCRDAVVWQRARAWLASTGRDDAWTISFERAAQIVGLEPEAVRKELGLAPEGVPDFRPWLDVRDAFGREWRQMWREAVAERWRRAS